MTRFHETQKRRIGLIAALSILAAVLLVGGSAWAAPRQERFDPPQRRDERRGGVRHERYVKQLPRGHVSIRVGREPYYYHQGTFYRHRPTGYLAVRAPIGAVIARLPIGFFTVTIGPNTYYRYDEVYYRRAPTGYIVVDPPEIAAAPAVTESQVSVTAALLNVRSGPGSNQTVLCRVDQGTVLTVFGQAPGWLYVQLPDGQLGWVMRQYTYPLDIAANG